MLIVPQLGDTVATGDFTKAREALAIGAQAAAASRGRVGAPVGADGAVMQHRMQARPQSAPTRR